MYKINVKYARIDKFYIYTKLFETDYKILLCVKNIKDRTDEIESRSKFKIINSSDKNEIGDIIKINEFNYVYETELSTYKYDVIKLIFEKTGKTNSL